MSNQSIQYETGSIDGYRPSHPWYYKLGGRILYPKEILVAVKLSDYQGYRQDELERLDVMAEPSRSSGLRSLRETCLRELKSDLSRYKEVARELRLYRLSSGIEEHEYSICNDPCTSISLKYCHLFNDFAHLLLIDQLLSKQPDLFDSF